MLRAVFIGVAAIAAAGIAALPAAAQHERARNVKCGADKPVIVGKQGPGFSGPYGD